MSAKTHSLVPGEDSSALAATSEQTPPGGLADRESTVLYQLFDSASTRLQRTDESDELRSVTFAFARLHIHGAQREFFAHTQPTAVERTAVSLWIQEFSRSFARPNYAAWVEQFVGLSTARTAREVVVLNRRLTRLSQQVAELTARVERAERFKSSSRTASAAAPHPIDGVAWAGLESAVTIVLKSLAPGILPEFLASESTVLLRGAMPATDQLAAHMIEFYAALSDRLDAELLERVTFLVDVDDEPEAGSIIGPPSVI